LGLLSVGLLGVVGLIYFTQQPAIPPMQPSPATSFERALLTKGAELAMLGNCNSCHTKQDGAAYAGGRPFETSFGTIYATNITPDPDTGIGSWSEAAFLRALREGVRRDGAHLYPAFPYDHFTKASVDDVRALYAFLLTREPVRAQTPANALPFPLSVRALIAGGAHTIDAPDNDRARALFRGAARAGATPSPTAPPVSGSVGAAPARPC
jgi:mono/diheme cytochrome c family protein